MFWNIKMGKKKVSDDADADDADDADDAGARKRTDVKKTDVDDYCAPAPAPSSTSNSPSLWRRRRRSWHRRAHLGPIEVYRQNRLWLRRKAAKQSVNNRFRVGSTIEKSVACRAAKMVWNWPPDFIRIILHTLAHTCIHLHQLECGWVDWEHCWNIRNG